jgi:hypothetical protein
MLDPIFSRSHRIPWAKDVPRTPTNQERVQAYRAIAPVEFWNTRFNPRRQSEAAAARGALADGVSSTEAAARDADAPRMAAMTVARRRAGAKAGSNPAETDATTVCRSSAPPASTPPPLKDEQPRRAASLKPGTNTHTPGA